MNLYKKCTTEPYYFSVIDTILASHNPLLEEILKKSRQLIIRLEIKNYNTILIGKQQKISALSSRKIDKYKYLTRNTNF